VCILVVVIIIIIKIIIKIILVKIIAQNLSLSSKSRASSPSPSASPFFSDDVAPPAGRGLFDALSLPLFLSFSFRDKKMAKNNIWGKESAQKKSALLFVQRDFALRAEHIDASFAGGGGGVGKESRASGCHRRTTTTTTTTTTFETKGLLRRRQ